MGRRGLIWLVAVISLLIAFFGSFELHSRGVSTVGGDGTAQAATVRDQVVRALQQSYYLPINKAVLRAHGLHGVLRALHDPYTQYLSPHAYQLVVTEEQSRFVGVGMAFTHVRGGLAVTATLPGLPAATAGLRPGDLITQIGLESLAPLSYDRDVRLLRGPVGSRVSLVVRRQHQATAHPHAGAHGRQPAQRVFEVDPLPRPRVLLPAAARLRRRRRATHP